MIKEKDKDEEEKTERRSKRNELCKRCFWFGILLNILDQAPTFEKTTVFATIVSGLPDNCEAINLEAEETVKKWISELPVEEKAEAVEEDEFKDHWFSLL